MLQLRSLHREKKRKNVLISRKEIFQKLYLPPLHSPLETPVLIKERLQNHIFFISCVQNKNTV